MRYTGHLILGGACWVGYSAAVNAVETLPHISLGSMLLALPLVLLASLLPDIDHPGSWVGRRTSPISDLISIFSHRGITHSMWAVLAIFWLFDQYGADSLLLQAVLVGYVSHLLGDAVTPAGVKLWWPLGRNQRIDVQQSIAVMVVGIIIFGVV